MTRLTRQEIAQYRPQPVPRPGEAPRERAQRRMESLGLWHPGQQMGRRWAIGCVALEITQRCNLDCTLCYLSENSEALKDLPLPELIRRIRMIREQYGEGTDLQITGGEPTLRRRDELLEVVRQARAAGLRPALFTNGIRATRELLAELCGAGLVDVAFHVDMTQRRPGYADEAELNRLRREYIERTRGLPLAVYFNTTVFDGNFSEIAALAAFFVANADAVRLASFQLQADTGRGIAGARTATITPDSVAERINLGAGAAIGFGAFDAGHPHCNRYAMALIANGNAHDLLDDVAFVRRVLQATPDVAFDRTRRARAVASVVARVLRRSALAAAGLAWLARKAWRMRRDLLASRGRVHKLSFFIHNFMDACTLERDRVDACVFAVATGDGPLSMCLHNAKRDSYLLEPVALPREGRVRWWDPLTGTLRDEKPPARPAILTAKTARGRARARAA